MSLTFKFSASYLTSLLKTSLTQFTGFFPPSLAYVYLKRNCIVCLPSYPDSARPPI